MKYLALHRGVWGKGSTKAAALRQLKAEGAPARLKLADITLYTCPDDYYIDELGRGFGDGGVTWISGPDLRN